GGSPARSGSARSPGFEAPCGASAYQTAPDGPRAPPMPSGGISRGIRVALGTTRPGDELLAYQRARQRLRGHAIPLRRRVPDVEEERSLTAPRGRPERGKQIDGHPTRAVAQCPQALLEVCGGVILLLGLEWEDHHHEPCTPRSGSVDDPSVLARQPIQGPRIGGSHRKDTALDGPGIDGVARDPAVAELRREPLADERARA